MNFSRRKSLFVNSQIQGSLLRRLCAFWILYHLCLWHFMFLVVAVRQPIGVSVFDFYRQFLRNETLLPVVAVAVFPIVFWGMLRLSHRVAGPLVQVRKRLREMASGEPPRELRFRNDDLMAELEEAFNAYVAYRCSQELSGVAGRDESTGGKDAELGLLRETVHLNDVIHGRGEPRVERAPTGFPSRSRGPTGDSALVVCPRESDEFQKPAAARNS